jgi:hypothetical protein
MAGRSTNEPQNYIAFGVQADQTTEASTFNFLRHLDGSGFEIDEQVESVREGGDGQEVGLRYKTAITFDGSMVCNARPEISARLDALAFGADSANALPGPASGASGVANYHIAVPTATLKYATVEQYWADVVERGIGAQVTGLTGEFEQGRPLKLTYEFMTGGSSYRRAVASVLTPTRETGQPFMYPGASVVFTGDAASGVNTKMTKGKFTLNRNLDGDIRTTGLNREDVVGQTMDTQLEATIKYESASTWYDPVHYDVGGTQIPFDLATGSFKITSVFGSGTQYREKEYGINMLDWTQARVNKLDPEGKTMYIDVVGMGRKSATYQMYSKTVVASSAAF